MKRKGRQTIKGALLPQLVQWAMELYPTKETGGQSKHTASYPIPREQGDRSMYVPTPVSHWLRSAMKEHLIPPALLPPIEVGEMDFNKVLRYKNAGSGRWEVDRSILKW